jgi:hypothetical protein
LNAARLIQEVEAARGSVALKYQVAKLALSGVVYEKGAQPYQDFDLLFKLRNAIVHMDAEPVTATPHKTIRLIDKKLCRPLGADEEVNWVQHIATPATGIWACNSALLMVLSLCESARCAVPSLGWMFALQTAFFGTIAEYGTGVAVTGSPA